MDHRQKPLKKMGFGGFLYFFLILMLLSAGCENGGNTAPETSGEGLAHLESLCDSVVEQTSVPGIIAGYWSDSSQTVWEYATGFADLVEETPMETGMYFRIASITKTMVNTVLFQLIDEGLLSMDDTLSQFRPDIPRSHSITLLMLSDMTSGIADYSTHPRFMQMTLADPLRVWHPDSLIALGTSLTPLSEPGETWYYSNTNTIILGRIIEQITEKTLSEELNNRIFEPCGLLHTSFPESGNDMPKPHPKGYYTGEAGFPVDWSESYDISVAWAAGAVISTLQDLREYAVCLTAGNLISAESHAFRLEHEVPTTIEGGYYGPGILRYESWYGHLGGLPGFTSVMLRNPQTAETIIIFYNAQLTNHQPADLAKKMINYLSKSPLAGSSPD
ncbi:MAG: D-alanyl-D-alanine carboxypeptidase [Candidatus Marinimicrobia bacterium]|jgi:D-alanyl-D-alanine carboxypeptidase|nr:D-alanyl-D-alanine carboxypeptidase [Candidatus Neomarinimicrobiota bacterium]